VVDVVIVVPATMPYAAGTAVVVFGQWRGDVRMATEWNGCAAGLSSGAKE